ncbi:GRAM domain-containing protein [Cephalotus follicularis]|uniref:GRAM domain-containing protein n=1 Tax=Cephalotus follicularis TaxID=3775 RepID=A0A1Q3B313_CEPFO|nr:GRAM domain-containing protein [Cephalotus follicularis]
MKNLPQEHTIGFPTILLSAYLVERPPIYLPAPSNQYNVPPPADGSLTIKQSRLNSMLHRMHKLGKKLKKVDNFAHRVREHVRLGPKVTELLTGKLIMGAIILQVGGVEKIFKQSFSVRGGEKLLKVSQCYLSTTSGPIAGLLFISSDKVAFRSERSIKVSSPNGELLSFHYKVLIPLTKIKKVNQSENVNNPSLKYIEIVTADNFDFWFMGFLKYEKSIKALQKAISQKLG